MVESAAGTSSFLTPCQGETQIGEYEVYHRRRGFFIGDLLVLLVLAGSGTPFWFMAQATDEARFARARLHIESDRQERQLDYLRTGVLPARDLGAADGGDPADIAEQRHAEASAGNLVLLALALLPAVLYLLRLLLLRRAKRGWLVLTNARLVYYQRESWPLGRGHLQFQVNLEDVCGMNAHYQRGLFGQESVHLSVLTSFGDHFAIGAAKGGLPLLRALRPNDIGRDAFRVLPALYAEVDHARRRTRQEAQP